MTSVDGRVFPQCPSLDIENVLSLGNYSLLLGKINSGQSSNRPVLKKNKKVNSKKSERLQSMGLEIPTQQYSLVIILENAAATTSAAVRTAAAMAPGMPA